MKLQSLFTPDLPVYSAKFINGGEKALLTGNRKHFYIYDVAANKLDRQVIGGIEQKNLSSVVVSPQEDLLAINSAESGRCHIYSQKTMKIVQSLKLNGSCTSASFSPDGKYLFTAGDQGDIFQWDLRSTSATKHQCVSKTNDVGNFHTTALEVSPDGKYLASGSKMGTVNIFELGDSYNLNPTPVKSILNLTTSITDLKFHPSSKMLALCSKWKKNAVRLVHLPSYSTY